jgi:hypothetical protein
MIVRAHPYPLASGENMGTKAKLAVAGAAVAALGTGLFAVQNAGFADGTVYTFHHLTPSDTPHDWCMDGNSNAQGGIPHERVFMHTCKNNDFQKWTVGGSESDGATLTVQGNETPKCLDGNETGDVYAVACNEGNYQKWKISQVVPDGGVRTVMIQNAQTGRCLQWDVPWKQVRSEPCQFGVKQQNWDI